MYDNLYNDTSKKFNYLKYFFVIFFILKTPFGTASYSQEFGSTNGKLKLEHWDRCFRTKI